MKRKHLFLLLLMIISLQVISQKTEVFDSPLITYKKAQDLYDKDKYSAAQRLFELAIEQEQNVNSEVSVTSEFYAALCAINLFNRDADLLLREFVAHHPESPYVKKAYFQLAKYNYRQRKHEKVIDWFEKIDTYDLSKEESSEYFFKLGYSYFKEKKYKEASKKFYQIKDTENQYAVPAQYYFAHIAYLDNNNQTALESFRKLEEHPKFSAVVPYYITQILYKQRKYGELVEYAPKILNKSNVKREAEIARLIGDAYFNRKQFEESAEYLTRYHKKTSKASREDKYQLAFALYKSKQYEEAINWFIKVTSGEDETTQVALYQMAECYLKSGNERYARNAFMEAYKLDFDEEIKEEALFNYAKLSYNLNYDPYNKSIRAFNEFIENYGSSDKADEAYTYLVNLYLTTKNYDEALQSIESIENLDVRLKEAYQRIAYNKAIEYYQNRKLSNSVEYFEVSRKYPIDDNLTALSYYWEGEANYKLKEYDKSIESYKKFIFEPASILQNVFHDAHYNLGYAYFQQEDYQNAQSWFRKYSSYGKKLDPVKLTDAELRTGDCFFISKKYPEAIIYYDRAIAIGKVDKDYGLYQKGMALGVQKNLEGKIATLLQVADSFDYSNYMDAIKFELGKSYVMLGKEDKALDYFNDVVENHPNSVYVKRSLESIALNYYNSGNNEEALEIYERIVEDYPTYEDTRQALDGIRNIYLAMGEVDKYADYIEALSFVDVSQATLDSVTYEAAEMKYAEGNCIAAVDLFSKYLSRFKPANFALNAHFYKAECLFNEGNKVEALEGYNFIIDQPKNKFTESALVNASEINFGQKNYQEALANFEFLEQSAAYSSNRTNAVIGQMRCNYYLGNYEKGLAYSQKVKRLEKVSEELQLESEYISAKSYYELDSLNEAFALFKKIKENSSSEEGAESNYYVALIHFENDSLTAAENEVFELVNKVPSYGYWIGKGLILLSDVYLTKGDAFQAKATLKSIVDNYSNEDDVLATAKENLENIIELEEAENEEEIIEEEEEIDIEFNDPIFDELFEEEEVDDKFEELLDEPEDSIEENFDTEALIEESEEEDPIEEQGEDSIHQQIENK